MIKTRQEIADWCTQFVAGMFDIPVAEVYGGAEFQSFGFDSTALVSFSAELEAWLGRELNPSVLFEYPTIDLLAQHISEQSK
ncbi:MAG: acyl carrier protein [Ramlibacter sp.]|nr:acyl carrier protein [Ramlibacter sp.]